MYLSIITIIITIIICYLSVIYNKNEVNEAKKNFISKGNEKKISIELDIDYVNEYDNDNFIYSSIDDMPASIKIYKYKIIYFQKIDFYFYISDGDFIKKGIKTSDYYLDKKIYINSKHEAGIIGLLNFKARQIIYLLSKISYNKQLEITNSYISFTTSSKDKIIISRLITDLVENLTREGSTYNFLIKNLYSDKNENVRTQNFRMLIKYYSLKKDISNIIQNALKDRNTDINLMALKVCKDDKNFYSQTEWVDYLISLYPAAHTGFQARIIECIAENLNCGNSTYNAFLVSQLSALEDNIVHAAIRALSKCGTINEILVLKAIKGWHFKSAACWAIQQIQKRLKDAEPGQLSLQRGSITEGQLSLTSTGRPGELQIKK